MEEKYKAKLKDLILQNISEKRTYVSRISEELNVDFDTVWSLCSEISRDGYINEREQITKNTRYKAVEITPDGKLFYNSSSYSCLYRGILLKKTQSYMVKIKDTTFKIITIIIMASSVIAVVYFGLKNNSKDKEIERLKKQIELLQNKSSEK